jgi:hypothetical protein
MRHLQLTKQLNYGLKLDIVIQYSQRLKTNNI